MQAVLAEKQNLELLKKHYVVAMDTMSSRNGCSFGVMVHMFDPDGTQVEKYWYGTGNAIIGMRPDRDEARRIAYHEKQVADMHYALAATVQKWELMKAGRNEAVLAQMLEQVRSNKPFAGHPLDRFNSWLLRGSALDKQLDTNVVLEDAARLTCEKLVDAFRKAGWEVRTEMAEASLQKPGSRYSRRPVTRSARKWLTSLHRYGLYWYVDGGPSGLQRRKIVVTDDVRAAVAHYQKTVPGCEVGEKFEQPTP